MEHREKTETRREKERQRGNPEALHPPMLFMLPGVPVSANVVRVPVCFVYFPGARPVEACCWPVGARYRKAHGEHGLSTDPLRGP